MKKPKIDSSAMGTVTFDQVVQTQKASKAMPTWGDIRDAFGEKAVTSKKVNLDPATSEGRTNRGKMMDMMAPAWRQEAVRGQSVTIPKTKLYNKRGEKVEAPVSTAENLIRENGFKTQRGLSFGPPRCGWPVFGKDGKVVG